MAKFFSESSGDRTYQGFLLFMGLMFGLVAILGWSMP